MPDVVWGEGARWCIRQKPDWRREQYPWVIEAPHVMGGAAIPFTTSYLGRLSAWMWCARLDFEMADGLDCELGRFRTFELACQAFACAAVAVVA